MMKQYKNKRGFSDDRIWPLYFIFSALLIILLPILGVFWGTLVPFIGMGILSRAIYAYTVKHKIAATMPEYEDMLKTLPTFIQEAGGTIQPQEPQATAPARRSVARN